MKNETMYESFLQGNISKKQYEKFSNPSFSLLEINEKKLVFSKRRNLIVFTSIGLYFLITAILLLGFAKFISGVIMLLLSQLLFGITVANLIDYRKNLGDIQKVKQLEKNNQIQELLALNMRSKNPVNWAVFALVDLKSKELIEPLLEQMKTCKNNSTVLDVLDVLIIKLGYPDREAFLQDIYFVVPTSKYFILNERPEKIIGMVSGLPIDFEKEEVVICPFCGNYAKKMLLNKWLQKNNSCPICRKKILFTECPIVKLEKKHPEN
ncbi:MAG: hypothetical protein GF308_08325 [Candidatus Heimdallarchaeota archaeon]|nr:hypothetical protein [Candidatus Heimdallarchaeota archaeon]